VRVRTDLTPSIFLIIIFLTGCSAAPETPRLSTGAATTSTTAARQTSNDTKDAVWQDNVTHAWVVAHPQNWNADAEDDGIRVWIELLDKNEKIVEYDNITMPVKLQLYADESKTNPAKPGSLLYSGTSVAQNWKHDAFVTFAVGVKDISWQEMSKPLPAEQQEYGIIYVTITLPNGKDYSARWSEARITKP
jgi:hypothetical protein